MKSVFLAFLLLNCYYCFAQVSVDEIIQLKEVQRIEKVLSADSMMGRKTFTKGIEKAGQFINNEFKKIGLQTWNNGTNYFQRFVVVKPRLLELSATINDSIINSKNVVVITAAAEITFTDKLNHETAIIKKEDDLLEAAYGYTQSKKNYIVLVDTSFSKLFGSLHFFKQQLFNNCGNIVFILSNSTPTTYTIHVKQQIEESALANVVGILPGKSRKKEYVVFSGHYDHLGIDKPQSNDSIYNGANDDAAGITAVIMLAKYFKALNNNDRTLVFAAFTAEEIGGFGSIYFSQQFNPSTVMAMFNIEMIGTQSKWGKNSAFITGYEKTNMGQLLQKNLKGSAFTFYPDPYPEQNLFYRSDNATLAKLGVPAHTISTSKMDSEPYYHTANDEIETLDMKNMAEIIKAIALSSKTIVMGKDTPGRIDVEKLKK